MKKRKENNKMNVVTKLLLSIVAMAGVGCIAFGIATYQNNKDADVQQAATQAEIQVNDNTIQKT